MRKIIIVIFLIFIFIYPVIGMNQSQYGNYAIDTYGNMAIYGQITQNHSTYSSLVDQIHGFYRIYKNENNLDKLVDYQNRTLNISVGDTVFWSNEAVPETELTIVSKQNLWKNIDCGQYLCADLRWDYKKFGYTFNKSGIYQIYIQQFPIFNQTIIVGPLPESTNNADNFSINNTISSTSTIANENMNENMNTQTMVTATPNLTTTNTKTATKSNENSYNFSISGIKVQISSRFDTVVLILVLLSMVILSGRIKEEKPDEVEDN